MVPTKLDHCVIHVSDWERSNKFYRRSDGRRIRRRGRRALPIASATSNSTCMGRASSRPRWRGCQCSRAIPICASSGRADRRRHRASEDARHRGRARAPAAVRRQGTGHNRLFPRPGRLADGVHVVRRRQMSEAPGMHNPNVLPPGIPAPQDDGAARHLTGMTLPNLALPATVRRPVNSGEAQGPQCGLRLSAHRRAGRRCAAGLG